MREVTLVSAMKKFLRDTVTPPTFYFLPTTSELSDSRALTASVWALAKGQLGAEPGLVLGRNTIGVSKN